MKSLYYVVEIELDSDAITGNKSLTVYDIVDNVPKQFAIIECDYSDNSKKVIQDYLNDNGYGDEEYNLIIL